jgi:exodeoxyribonuclease VII large subunit
LRVAGEGDLLIQLELLRRRLAADGLFEPQKLLPRARLPRVIGVVTGEQGKARDDVLAGLRRRGWQGRLIWAFAPVQDRRAAPAIAASLRELAAIEEVDVVIVARGGGSLADLFAFCDETLCRTVALLRVPVISSVGHHTDRTLIDDVAAVACSTPTHAAEEAVPFDLRAARATLAAAAARLDSHGRRAVLTRARTLATLSRAPGVHLERHRARLLMAARELRSGSARGTVVAQRRRELDRILSALNAHDPQRTLERGYALVSGPDGSLVGSAAQAQAAGRLSVRFHDGTVSTRVASDEP